uniref:Uncharacterized protein n=1 Tax=Ditylenchus dipsaci TaxID=166011 RepID=A0A915EB34_9BILA
MVMLLLHYRTSLTLQFVFLLAALAQVGNSMGPVDDTLPSGSNPAPPAPAPLSAPPTPAAAPPPSMPSFFQGLEEANPFLKIDFKDHQLREEIFPPHPTLGYDEFRRIWWWNA